MWLLGFSFTSPGKLGFALELTVGKAWAEYASLKLSQSHVQYKLESHFQRLWLCHFWYNSEHCPLPAEWTGIAATPHLENEAVVVLVSHWNPCCFLFAFIRNSGTATRMWSMLLSELTQLEIFQTAATDCIKVWVISEHDTAAAVSHYTNQSKWRPWRSQKWGRIPW